MASATSKTPWQETANSKREGRESKVPSRWRIPASQLPPTDQRFVEHWPRESGLLTSKELQVTEATASEVVRRIASRQWTSEQVTTAVCKRAAIAQQLVNCTTEIFFDEAILRARKLDKYLRDTGDVIGPLHGLPISLKDQFDVKGIDSTIGYVSRVGRPSTDDAALVTLLQNAGAVLYVKTNVPTTLMMGETINYLFGPTVNPRNRALTPGGSSGGESALLALRGSFLGVGTDIGGSIRNPCAWTGLYGLRPSVGRVPCRGVTTSFAGQEAIRSTTGPMCRHPADIRLFMSAVAGGEPWQHDPDVLPIPWRPGEEELPRMICFGIAWHDGHVQPTPPIRRALEITRAKLLAAGHKVIDFTPAENAAANRIAYKMWSADGGLDVQRATEATREPLPERVESWMGKSARLQPLTTSQVWEIQKRRTTLAGEWLDRWNRTAGETGTGRPIDGLIMPSAAFPAPRHESGFPWTYSALAPLLDLTTGVFPVSKVDLGKDVIPDNWKPLSKKDTEVREFYGKPENHENALVGLVLVGRRLEEEKVTAMLQVLHDTVGTDYEYGDDWDELKGSPVPQPKL